MRDASLEKTVLVDGFNMALPKGTGVATYARNLCDSLDSIGWSVNVLYGLDVLDTNDPLLKEVSFFEPNHMADSISKRLRSALLKLMISPNQSFKGGQVPMTGVVLTNGLQNQLPPCDGIYNVRKLYQRAEMLFDLTRRLSRVRLKADIQVAHWTYPMPIYYPGAINIYTLHDLVPLRLPFTTLDNKRRYLRLLRALGKNADHFVTVSENSKSDLINILGVDESRVTVTYQSASDTERYVARMDIKSIKETIGIYNQGYRGYFLYFGSLEPKKNIGRIIEAYLGSGLKTPLLIVGAQSWKMEDELRILNDYRRMSSKQFNDPTEQVSKPIDTAQFASNMGRDDNVFIIEYASRSTLLALITGAKATVFPSIYEGFGLPVLESMLLGTPVLSSTTGSVPEVAGDACLLVDPYKPADIKTAMIQLDRDAELRDELAARGKRRAALFSEARYRDRIRDLYDRVSARRQSESG